MDVIVVGDRQRLSGPACPADAEYALGGIAQQPSAGISCFSAAFQLSRLPGPALFHRNHRRLKCRSPGHSQQLSLSVADSVPQRTESACVRVIPGDSTDTCDALAQIDTQPGAVTAAPGHHMKGMGVASPAYGQLHPAAGGTKGAADISGRIDNPSVDHDYFISYPQSRISCRRTQRIIKSGNGNRIITELQSDDPSHRDQELLRPDIHGSCREQQERKDGGSP